MKKALFLASLFILLGVSSLRAQRFSVETYRITVTTGAGERIQGLLEDIDEANLYCDNTVVPLSAIRKVRLRRLTERSRALNGAIAGGLVVAYATIQGLKKNPTRSPVTYGLTLGFATGAGAALGAVVSSLLGHLFHRNLRLKILAVPTDTDALRRQLEPFSFRYQSDRLNQMPR